MGLVVFPALQSKRELRWQHLILNVGNSTRAPEESVEIANSAADFASARRTQTWWFPSPLETLPMLGNIPLPVGWNTPIKVGGAADRHVAGPPLSFGKFTLVGAQAWMGPGGTP